jgi:hypothetical protein
MLDILGAGRLADALCFRLEGQEIEVSVLVRTQLRQLILQRIQTSVQLGSGQHGNVTFETRNLARRASNRREESHSTVMARTVFVVILAVRSTEPATHSPSTRAAGPAAALGLTAFLGAAAAADAGRALRRHLPLRRNRRQVQRLANEVAQRHDQVCMKIRRIPTATTDTSTRPSSVLSIVLQLEKSNRLRMGYPANSSQVICRIAAVVSTTSPILASTISDSARFFTAASAATAPETTRTSYSRALASTAVAITQESAVMPVR